MSGAYETGEPSEAASKASVPHVERILAAELFLLATERGERLDAVAEIVTADDFEFAACRALFVAVFALREKCDLVTVPVHLSNSARIKSEDQWRQWLIEASQEVRHGAKAEHHAQIVRRASLLRGMARAANTTAAEAADVDPTREADVAKFLEGAGARFWAASTSLRTGAREQTLAQSMRGVVERLERSEDMAGVQTGISALDEVLVGMVPGDLIVVAARPSVGKSTFASQVALNVARSQAPVLIVSLEMTSEQMAVRALQNVSGVDGFKFKKPAQLTSQDRDDIAAAEAELAALPIQFVEAYGATPSTIRSAVRRNASAGLVIVDYLQLMDEAGHDSRNNEIGAITGQCKQLAREFRIPIVLLSQLSRGAVDGEEPQLAHLRDSGAIEQDADGVIFLWKHAEVGKLHCKVAKNRMGPLGPVELAFIRERFLIGSLGWGHAA